MVYIDKPKNKYSHLVADSITELHNFADIIGVNRCWFENKRGKNQPHYDIKEEYYDNAILNGAIIVNTRFIVDFLKRNYNI